MEKTMGKEQREEIFFLIERLHKEAEAKRKKQRKIYLETSTENLRRV